MLMKVSSKSLTSEQYRNLPPLFLKFTVNSSSTGSSFSGKYLLSSWALSLFCPEDNNFPKTFLKKLIHILINRKLEFPPKGQIYKKSLCKRKFNKDFCVCVEVKALLFYSFGSCYFFFSFVKRSFSKDIF